MKKETRNNLILWPTISFVILLFTLPVLRMAMAGRDEQNRIARLNKKVARLEKERRLNPTPKYKSSEYYPTAIAAVKQTITIVSTSDCVYRTGFFEDGVAVFVEKKVNSCILEATYWVQNGHVYAANGIAKMWSPSISYSKTGIDFDSVEKTVQQFEREEEIRKLAKEITQKIAEAKEKKTAQPEPRYTIVETKDISFHHCKRYSIRVRVDHALSSNELKTISNKIIANFKATRPFNALTIFFYLPDSDIHSVYTEGMIEYAPYGDWSRADDVQTGEYSKHSLKLFTR